MNVDRAEVLISRRAARVLFDEVQRWVDHGLKNSGTPLESLTYPLSALVPRDGRWRTPLELTNDADIAQIVIDDVAVPPESVKAFSAANCHFAGDQLHEVNAAFNASIDERIGQQPRLGVHSKLHCHPFIDGAFLSQGDRYYGVASPQAASWRQQRGLGTAVLHVVFPDARPRLADRPWRIESTGAVCAAKDATERVCWRVRSWASSPDGSLIDLGNAKVVSNLHRSVRAARRAAYWQTSRGNSWCDEQKGALRDAGYAVSRNVMPRGWRRYLFGAGNRTLLVALPPDFPAAPMRVLEVRQAWCNNFETLEVPSALTRKRWPSLLAIARHFGKPTPT